MSAFNVNKKGNASLRNLSVPIVFDVSKTPVQCVGSIVYDSSRREIYVACEYGWMPMGSANTPDTTIKSRATTDDVYARTVVASKRITLPYSQDVVSTPVIAQGSIAFDTTTKIIYYSTLTEWLPLAGGSGVVTLSSAGGTTLVNNGTSPGLIIKGLTAGTGVTLSSTASEITITNSSPASSVTLTNIGTTNLVGSGVGPALTLKGLVSGTGITLSSSATDITITNSSPGVSYTAGTGINISGTTISNTGVLSVTAGNSTIVVSGTAANPIISGGYTAGSGISITAASIASTVNVSSEPTGVGIYSLLSTNTSSPNYITKTITAGSNITIVDSGTTLTLSSTGGGSFNPLGFSARKNATQLMTWPVDANVVGWTTTSPYNFDTTTSAFNVTTGVFTAQITGIHTINATVSFNSVSNAGLYNLALNINGTDEYITEDQSVSYVAYRTCLRLSVSMELTVGDVMTLHVLGNSPTTGDDVTISSGANTWWSIIF